MRAARYRVKAPAGRAGQRAPGGGIPSRARRVLKDNDRRRPTRDRTAAGPRRCRESGAAHCDPRGSGLAAHTDMTGAQETGACQAADGDAPLRLMAVHAHPDDESSKGGATMARYVREGAEVLVCTLTGGERGDILNKAMDRPEVRANLSKIRREEMARAREILGVRQKFLGFVDSGLPEGDPLPPLPDGCFALTPVAEAAESLVRAIREFRPHVILTYDENGGYPHPDHVMTHKVTALAFDAAADPDEYPESGDPWQPLKLYYFASFHVERFVALH